MAVIDRKALLSCFQRDMDSDHVALFLGAGMSRASGFVDWKGLMQEVAEELGLDINKETDLIALAQWHKNRRKGRHRINQLLVTEFTKDAALTESHHLIASLPISTIWTTNYDHLIEDAYRAAHRRIDVKRRGEDLLVSLPRADATIYKMHGDVDQPDDAVLTKEDYATFDKTRNLFSVQLRGHLVSKSFLFLGYSFSDPNIDFILARIRAQLGDKRRDHYCVMRRIQRSAGMSDAEAAEADYETRKLELRIDDLQNYGIQTLLVDSYDDVTGLLRSLKHAAVRHNVFISGSAADFLPLGRERLESLARSLGHDLIKNGYNVISGLGLGIGGAVTIGALERLYLSPEPQLDERLTLRPFPQVAPSHGSKAEIWERYRQDMMSRAGFALFLAGNKIDAATGQIIEAPGVLREFDIAVERGVYPIPVGATGHGARRLSERVLADPAKYFGDFAGAVKGHLGTLADAGAGEAKWNEAVNGILRAIAPK